MSNLVRRLRDPEFGTETSERNLMNQAADEIERLRAALADAGRALDGAARKMKGNCSSGDVAAVMLAAGRTAEARAALKEPRT